LIPFYYIGILQFNWFTDGLDIILVTVLLYQLFKIVRKTNAVNIFAGILAIYLLWIIVDSLGMKMLSKTIGQFIDVGVIALIIVFQQEIRKFLVVLGRRSSHFTSSNKWINKLLQKKDNHIKATPEEIKNIASSCYEMSKTLTGAIIIIRKKDNLAFYEETGEEIDAKVTTSILNSIFYKNSPLHDGAVIVEKGRVVAARCVLPVTEKEDFPIELGMRHRAGVGITEQTDAIAIMVSEQSGSVSISKNGVLYPKLDLPKFINKLEELSLEN
jgi:diadenylate cyclase